MQQLVEARKDKNLKTFVVIMSGPESKDAIQQMTTERKITIPVTFLPKGPGAADVGAYKINPAARNTVVLWKQGTFRANFVNVDRNTFPEVEKAVDEMLK